MTRVLLFAQARELAGTRAEELAGDTVTEVLDAAAAQFGSDFARLCATCTVVVDGDTVVRSKFATTAPGDELAILPPVSGGAHEVDDGPDRLRVAVITVSDRASDGTYEDLTGPAVEHVLVDALDASVVGRQIVPDEAPLIAAAVIAWCDDSDADLVVTNGGTGLSPRDVTPEATRAVLDVEAPGLAELMRTRGLASTPLAALSRQVVGRRGDTIVVNLPGSIKGAVESLEAISVVLPHAVAMARTGR